MEHEERQGMPEAGSFQLGDSVDLMKMRQRHQELVRKIRCGTVSDMERDEYLRLDDALHEQNRAAGGTRRGDGQA